MHPVIEVALGFGAWVVVALALAVWVGRTADVADDQRPEVVTNRVSVFDPHRSPPRLLTHPAIPDR